MEGKALCLGGYWMSTLHDALAGHNNIKLGVVTICPTTSDFHFEYKGVDYYVIGRFRYIREMLWRRYLKKCAKIASDWNPDLIHVHGTESYYGLLKARGYVKCPMVVSIQGLLSEYQRCYFGSLSCREIVKSQRISELLRGSGLIWDYYRMRKNAVWERTIIRSADYILGRTTWDRAHILELNPMAKYFHVGEILRSCFYQNAWDINRVRRYGLFVTNADSPRRGVEILIRAIRLLVSEFPGIKLKMAGNLAMGYGRFLRKYINRSGISDHIECLGHLDGPQIADEICRAHVYVISSHSENSPNSLAEAMLLGAPCVAAYSGGIPSMIADNHSGLLFAPGDIAVLADRIRSIFKDDNLAVRLGKTAHDEASVRHDPVRVIDQLLNAYKSLAYSDAKDA
jgi:glycosyltransferase involved in cell wall biosynthesis